MKIAATFLLLVVACVMVWATPRAFATATVPPADDVFTSIEQAGPSPDTPSSEEAAPPTTPEAAGAWAFVKRLVRAGLASLKDYILLHVVTCLIPAFLLAGAMVAFVSKEAIIRHLGSAVRKVKSFAIASVGSFFVAACSCTVIPVASGIYYSGSGVGPAFILLWVAPAANVLALVYTGNILGADLMLARIVAALAMGFAVGGVMVLVFRREEAQRQTAVTVPDPGTQLVSRADVVLLLLLVVSLLAPNYLVRTGGYGWKVLVWGVATVLIAGYVVKTKSWPEIRRWLAETWWFARIILPLLLVGVFVVGVITALLPREWIEAHLGGSSVRASFLATLIGAISYFATMTEAPFVDGLIKLGMGKGPALALLLTGPGLSLPNWLAIARVFGVKKALVYVPTIIVLGTLVGWLAGVVLF